MYYKSKSSEPGHTMTPLASAAAAMSNHMNFSISQSLLPASFQQFIADMLALISREENPTTALRLAQWLALYLWENPIGLYRLDDIEDIVAKKLTSFARPGGSIHHEPGELHVASAVYRTGGHTALMRCLMQQCKTPVHVLLTRSDDMADDLQILGLNNASQLTGTSNTLSAEQKLQHLVDCMTKYRRVVLHIHPDDVLCAVAARLSKQLCPDMQLVLVNHADHVFSVGWTAIDKVLEISAYGWGLQAKRGIESKASFIGIPIQSPTNVPSRHASSPPFAMSGGASYKFKPVLGMSLPSALRRLLDEEPQLHMKIVGASGKDWWWWPLKLRFRGRVHLLKALPKAEYKKLLDTCALYIDSYPWLGGTAFPEALMLGVPVAGLRGVAWGYSCADELRSSSVDAFVKDCRQLLANKHVGNLLANARQRCVDYHSAQAVRQRMDDFLDGGVRHEPAGLSGEGSPQEHRSPHPRSQLPSRQRGGLTPADMQSVARLHRAAFGWTDWASITLSFYAWRYRRGR